MADKKLDHVEENQFKEPSSRNPFTSPSISLSLPETIEIKMVDASSFSEYEIWGLFSSLSFSAVIGFVIALFQNQNEVLETFLEVITGVFFLLFSSFLITFLYKRHKIKVQSEVKKFKLVPVE